MRYRLKEYVVKRISLDNNLDAVDQIKLNNSYSLELADSNDGGIVKLGINIKSEDEKLSVNAEMIGIFDRKFETLENDTFDELLEQMYPYLRCAVANLTSTARLPLIDIPPLKMNK